jgi:hypothetical protein
MRGRESPDGCPPSSSQDRKSGEFQLFVGFCPVKASSVVRDGRISVLWRSS